ncbi:MAG: 1,4-dihydroxy-2-naphthoate polyprenyltransferase [Propionibacteriaceae bacterium]|jgi:1,4-dihydroxy-2-naphthoate octaprenyltransferase|nr:1,4-dihydroxy-2-naphthoate polyprenyltransferase [Propionibacteriaceae bacterium]
MASIAQWVEGARLRTLPAAISPVVGGAAIAIYEHQFDWLLCILALVTALLIQIGSNLANDYSDGIRGTDAERVGPLRLVGSGAARPKQVLGAALGCWVLAAVTGLVVVMLTGYWWLLAVGAGCIVAAWFYTGGKHPYGYAGLGELFVFVCYGLVAVNFTVFIQVGAFTWGGLWVSVALGLLCCGILVANNLRDIDGDLAAGKRTLATKMGAPGTRYFYLALVIAATLAVVAVALATDWWALLGLAMLVLLVDPLRLVLRGATGRPLIYVLKLTGLAELLCSLGLLVGLLG